MTEDEMAGWHHRPDGHEFEHTPGDGEGQGSLVHCSAWGHKESDTTLGLNSSHSDLPYIHFIDEKMMDKKKKAKINKMK